MDNPGPGAPLGQIRLAKQRVQEQMETKLREFKELTKESVRLELLEATATASPAATVSPTAPASLPVVSSAADIPALSVDAFDDLNALDDFDDLDALDVFNAVPSITDSIAAPAAADLPVVVLDDPDSPTFAAAALPTASSATPAAPAAASPPAATLTTIAFLALVALHATLAVAPDSPVVALDALVSHIASTDKALTGPDMSADTLDALPPFHSIVAAPFTETDSAAPATSVTTDAHAAALDNSESRAPPTKRQRTGVLYDSNDELVTLTGLREAFGSFFFIPPTMFYAIYHRIVRGQLAPNSTKLQEFIRIFRTTTGFKFLTIYVGSADSDEATSLDLIQRDGLEYTTMCKRLKTHLRLPGGYGSPIPEPLLCYHLAMLVCMPIGQLSRDVLEKLFWTVTGQSLRPIRVVSSSGTNLMSTIDSCEMVQNWIRSICQFIVEGGRMVELLHRATACHDAYMKKCNPRGNARAGSNTDGAKAKGNARVNLDPNGAIAKKMMEVNECFSQLLLGVGIPELQILFKYLPDLMKGQGNDLVEPLSKESDSFYSQL
ncbi:hypothetical protein GGI17_003960 [Coemansia sp. S146]|nr:hypothetical protein GGI17_003960 [Coemansia sp. S146]